MYELYGFFRALTVLEKRTTIPLYEQSHNYQTNANFEGYLGR